MTFTAIVASVRPRTGKTLFARLLAENFVLSGTRPAIYDTDATERTLAACFPEDGVALNLDSVPDQMKLFDTLAVDSPKSRVVDVVHRSFHKFFDLMRSSDYVGEARAHGIVPVIFYIPANDPDSFDRGRELHEQFPACPFVPVRNACLGEVPPFTRLGAGYRVLEGLQPHIDLPAFDPSLANVIEDPRMSWSEFMQQTRSELSFVGHDGMRSWLLRSLREVYNALQSIQTRGAGRPLREREG